ncbi:MAG: cupin domain-containing protein [Spirosomataceae bacterium]
MKSAAYWVENTKCNHPEGGYFVETYRSSETIAHHALLLVFRSSEFWDRHLFFVRKSSLLSLSPYPTDEMWHFYTGEPLDVYVIHLDETSK